MKSKGDPRNKSINGSKETQDAFDAALRSAMGFFVMGAKQGRVRTDKEMLERLDTFFTTCAEDHLMPTVEKMALSLGMDVKYMNEIAEGRRPGLAGSFVTGEILRQAKLVIASVDAEMAVTGKFQPIVYIWRSKNYYGMADRKNVDVAVDDGTGRKSERDLLAEAAALPELSPGKKGK